MRIPLLLVSALMLAAVASAADITLVDGRVLHQASIVSQTPRTVFVRHAGGLSSVAKEQLPAELLARYPVDEVAARAADERAREAADALRASEQAAAERRAQLQSAAAAEAAQQEKTAKAAALRKEQAAESRALAAHRQTAERLVEHYFLDRARSAITKTQCSATIREFRSLNDRGGPWVATGSVRITSNYYGDPRPEPYPARDHPFPTARHHADDHWRRPDVEETREFEAIYTADGGEPTVAVTVR
jgi:hypothetical protein